MTTTTTTTTTTIERVDQTQKPRIVMRGFSLSSMVRQLMGELEYDAVE